MKNLKILKFISIMVSVFIIMTSINDFVYAISATPSMQQPLTNTDVLKNFNVNTNIISYNLGKITSAINCNSDTVIINIQDFHCNPSVQKNISDILLTLVNKYNIKSVYLEGGYGNINTKWLSDIKDEKLRNLFIQTLLQNGSLTGAEYFCAVNPSKDIKLYGMETENVYKENFERLQNIFSDKQKYKQIIKTFEKDLTFLQNKYLNVKNKKFNDLINKYKNGKINSRKYYKILFQYVQKYGKPTNGIYGTLLPINMDNYPNIKTYMLLGQYEKNIKYSKITVELKQILAALKTTVSYEQYNNIIKNTNNLKDISELVTVLNTMPEDFKNNNFSIEMKNFINYVEISKQINPVQLVEEERILVENIRLALSNSEAELDITFLSDFFGYFKDYLNTSITADNYKYFSQNFNKFRNLWDKYTYYNQINKYEKEFNLLSNYYETNVKRDYLFLENIKETNNLVPGNKGKADNNYVDILKNSKNIIVVVTGGFHTEGLKNIVTKNKISYMVITPNVKGNIDFANSRYEQLLQMPQIDITKQAFQLPLLSNRNRINVIYEGLRNLDIQPTQENIEILNEIANKNIFSLDNNKIVIDEKFFNDINFNAEENNTPEIIQIVEEVFEDMFEGVNPKNYADKTFSVMKKFAPDSNGMIYEISNFDNSVIEQLREMGYSEYLPDFLQYAYYNIGKKIESRYLIINKDNLSNNAYYNDVSDKILEIFKKNNVDINLEENSRVFNFIVSLLLNNPDITSEDLRKLNGTKTDIAELILEAFNKKAAGLDKTDTYYRTVLNRIEDITIVLEIKEAEEISFVSFQVSGIDGNPKLFVTTRNEDRYGEGNNGSVINFNEYFKAGKNYEVLNIHILDDKNIRYKPFDNLLDTNKNEELEKNIDKKTVESIGYDYLEIISLNDFVKYKTLNEPENLTQNIIKHLEEGKVVALFPPFCNLDLQNINSFEELKYIYDAIRTILWDFSEDFKNETNDDNLRLGEQDNALNEILKNAFVHGNNLKTNQPIYLYIKDGRLCISNAVDDKNIATAKQKTAATMSGLCGVHIGIENLQNSEGLDYKDEKTNSLFNASFKTNLKIKETEKKQEEKVKEYEFAPHKCPFIIKFPNGKVVEVLRELNGGNEQYYILDENCNSWDTAVKFGNDEESIKINGKKTNKQVKIDVIEYLKKQDYAKDKKGNSVIDYKDTGDKYNIFISANEDVEFIDVLEISKGLQIYDKDSSYKQKRMDKDVISVLNNTASNKYSQSSNMINAAEIQNVSNLNDDQVVFICLQDFVDIAAQSDKKKRIEEYVKYAVKNNKPIIIYPNIYVDEEDLSNADLKFLFKILGDRFVDFANFYVSAISPYIIELSNLNELSEYKEKIFPKDLENLLGYSLKEIMKNAFVHGNLSELNKPIIINFDENNPQIDILTVNTGKEENVYRKLLTFPTDLRGHGKGISEIKEDFNKFCDKYSKITISKNNKWQYLDNFGKENRVISRASLKLNNKEIKNFDDDIIYRGKRDNPFIFKLSDTYMFLVEPVTAAYQQRGYVISVENNRIRGSEKEGNVVFPFLPFAYGLEIKEANEETIIRKVRDLPDNISIIPVSELSPINFAISTLDEISRKFFQKDKNNSKETKNIKDDTYEVVFLEDLMRGTADKIMDMWDSIDENMAKGKPIKIYPLRNYDTKKVIDEISEQDYDNFVQLYRNLNIVITTFCDNYCSKFFEQEKFADLDNEQIKDLRKEFRYGLVEMVKNAIVHGNYLDLSKPITLEFDKETFEIKISNEYSQVSEKEHDNALQLLKEIHPIKSPEDENNIQKDADIVSQLFKEYSHLSKKDSLKVLKQFFTLKHLVADGGLAGFGLGIEKMSDKDKTFVYSDNFQEGKRTISQASLKLDDIKYKKLLLSKIQIDQKVADYLIKRDFIDENCINSLLNNNKAEFLINLSKNIEKGLKRNEYEFESIENINFVIEKKDGTFFSLKPMYISYGEYKLGISAINGDYYNSRNQPDLTLNDLLYSKDGTDVIENIYVFDGRDYIEYEKEYSEKLKNSPTVEKVLDMHDINKINEDKKNVSVYTLDSFVKDKENFVLNLFKDLQQGKTIALYPCPSQSPSIKDSIFMYKYLNRIFFVELSNMLTQELKNSSDLQLPNNFSIAIHEALKNAFVHGNNLTDRPIFLSMQGDKLCISNIVDKETMLDNKEKISAVLANLTGVHAGNNFIMAFIPLADYKYSDINKLKTGDVYESSIRVGYIKNIIYRDMYEGKCDNIKVTDLMIELPDNGKYNSKYVYIKPADENKNKLAVSVVDNEDKSSEKEVLYLDNLDKKTLQKYGIKSFNSLIEGSDDELYFQIELEEGVKLFYLSDKYLNENKDGKIDEDKILEFEKNSRNKKDKQKQLMTQANKNNRDFLEKAGIKDKEIVDIANTDLSDVSNLEQYNVVFNLQDLDMKKTEKKQNDLINKNIKYCIEKNIPIVMYPCLSNDIKNMDYSDLRMLFVITNGKFENFCQNYYGEAFVEYWRTQGTFKKYIKFSIFEMLKNAFVHGNNADLSLPIIIKPTKNKIEVMNDNTRNKSIADNKKVNLLGKFFAAIGHFHGRGLGIERMKEFEELVIYSDNNINKTENDDLWVSSIEKNKEFSSLYFKEDIDYEEIKIKMKEKIDVEDDILEYLINDVISISDEELFNILKKDKSEILKMLFDQIEKKADEVNFFSQEITKLEKINIIIEKQYGTTVALTLRNNKLAIVVQNGDSVKYEYIDDYAKNDLIKNVKNIHIASIDYIDRKRINYKSRYTRYKEQYENEIKKHENNEVDIKLQENYPNIATVNDIGFKETTDLTLDEFVKDKEKFKENLFDNLQNGKCVALFPYSPKFAKEPQTTAEISAENSIFKNYYINSEFLKEISFYLAKQIRENSDVYFSIDYGYDIWEMLKNAVVHGNNLSFDKPIFLYIKDGRLCITNIVNEEKTINYEKTKAVLANLTGVHNGINYIKSHPQLKYVNEIKKDSIYEASIDIGNIMYKYVKENSSDILYKGAYNDSLIIDVPGKETVFVRVHKNKYIIEVKDGKVNKWEEKPFIPSDYGLELKTSSDGQLITITKGKKYKDGTVVAGIPIQYNDNNLENKKDKSTQAQKNLKEQNENNKQFFNDLGINISNKDEYEIIHLQEIPSDLDYKIRTAVNNGKSLIIYPYLYNDFNDALENKDYAKLYFLLDEIGKNLVDFTNTYAGIAANGFDGEFSMNLKTAVREVVKNSIIHGNGIDLSLPIVIKFDKGKERVDIFNQNIENEQDKILINIASASGWSGFGDGVNLMKSYTTLEYFDNNNPGNDKGRISNDKIWQTTLKRKRNNLKEIKNKMGAKIDTDNETMEYLINNIISLDEETLLEILDKDKSEILKMLFDELDKTLFNLEPNSQQIKILNKINIIIETKDGNSMALGLSGIYAENGNRYVYNGYLSEEIIDNLIENVKNIHIAYIDDKDYEDNYKEEYETTLKGYNSDVVSGMLQKNYPSTEIVNKMGFDDTDLVYLRLDDFVKDKGAFKENLFKNLQDGKLIALFPFPYLMLEKSARESVYKYKYINEFFKSVSAYLAEQTGVNADTDILEMFKNAFVHGSNLNLDKPIFLYIKDGRFYITNMVDKENTAENYQQTLAVLANLTGSHEGLNFINTNTQLEYQYPDINELKTGDLYETSIKIGNIQKNNEQSKNNNISQVYKLMKDIPSSLVNICVSMFEISDATHYCINYEFINDINSVINKKENIKELQNEKILNVKIINKNIDKDIYANNIKLTNSGLKVNGEIVWINKNNNDLIVYCKEQNYEEILSVAKNIAEKTVKTNKITEFCIDTRANAPIVSEINGITTINSSVYNELKENKVSDIQISSAIKDANIMEQKAKSLYSVSKGNQIFLEYEIKDDISYNNFVNKVLNENLGFGYAIDIETVNKYGKDFETELEKAEKEKNINIYIKGKDKPINFKRIENFNDIKTLEEKIEEINFSDNIPLIPASKLFSLVEEERFTDKFAMLNKLANLLFIKREYNEDYVKDLANTADEKLLKEISGYGIETILNNLHENNIENISNLLLQNPTINIIFKKIEKNAPEKADQLKMEFIKTITVRTILYNLAGNQILKEEYMEKLNDIENLFEEVLKDETQYNRIKIKDNSLSFDNDGIEIIEKIKQDFGMEFIDILTENYNAITKLEYILTYLIDDNQKLKKEDTDFNSAVEIKALLSAA